MRIVDVCAFYSPHGGGVKTYIHHKLEVAPKLGHEVIILVPSSDPAIQEYGPGARIEYVPGRRFPLDGRYHYFHDEKVVHDRLTALKPDFVEASTPWSSATIVARWPGSAQRSLIMHADPLGNYAYRWFGRIANRTMIDQAFFWFWRHLKWLDERFDHIVCASDDLAARLTEGGLLNVETNRMGVQPGIFSPERRNEQLRRELLQSCGVDETGLLILGAGRHAPEKRWPMIIKSLTSGQFDKKIGLVIAGEGRARNKAIRAADGQRNVLLIPPILDRPAFAELMASADLLVHGSESETFCMVGAEARASGLPMLLPDRGAASDHLVPNAGLHYKATNGHSLAKSLRQLMRDTVEDHQEVARAAAAGTRTMDAHFEELFAGYRTSVHSCRARSTWKRPLVPATA